jgi:NADH dehydrogenase
MSFKDVFEEILEITRRKRVLLPLPWGLASLIGKIATFIPFIDPPLTDDQVTLLRNDNVVSAEAAKEKRTLAGIGIAPTNVETILPTYLSRYRPHGQYSGTGSEA